MKTEYTVKIDRVLKIAVVLVNSADYTISAAIEKSIELIFAFKNKPIKCFVEMITAKYNARYTY